MASNLSGLDEIISGGSDDGGIAKLVQNDVSAKAPDPDVKDDFLNDLLKDDGLFTTTKQNPNQEFAQNSIPDFTQNSSSEFTQNSASEFTQSFTMPEFNQNSRTETRTAPPRDSKNNRNSTADLFNFDDKPNASAIDMGDLFGNNSSGEMPTVEEQRQATINLVVGDVKNDTTLLAVQIKDDDRIQVYEDIMDYREMLDNDGIKLEDLKLTRDSPIEELNKELHLLKLSSYRLRNASLAEDCISMIAKAFEWMFDGRKSYRGMRPNMTGWHHEVKTKLRRMRPETSSAAASIKQKLGIGPVGTILLELLPSAVLYSSMPNNDKKNNNDDTAAKMNDVP